MFFFLIFSFSGTKKPGETLSKFKSISSKAYYICLITHWIGIIFAFFDSRDFARIGEITILVTAVSKIKFNKAKYVFQFLFLITDCSYYYIFTMLHLQWSFNL